MAFYIKSTDPRTNQSLYYSEDGNITYTQNTYAGVTSHAKAYSKESEAQSFIDSYQTNWIGFQKSIGLTFSVVEVEDAPSIG